MISEQVYQLCTLVEIYQLWRIIYGLHNAHQWNLLDFKKNIDSCPVLLGVLHPGDAGSTPQQEHHEEYGQNEGKYNIIFKILL